MQTTLCKIISPGAGANAGECGEREDDYDVDSTTYDPAYDVPDLSDTEEEENLNGLQEERLTQWRQDTQQLSSTTRQVYM